MVFANDGPKRLIASLELLAALYGMLLFCKTEAGPYEGTGPSLYSAGTDNKGNEGP